MTNVKAGDTKESNSNSLMYLLVQFTFVIIWLIREVIDFKNVSSD